MHFISHGNIRKNVLSPHGILTCAEMAQPIQGHYRMSLLNLKEPHFRTVWNTLGRTWPKIKATDIDRDVQGEGAHK